MARSLPSFADSVSTVPFGVVLKCPRERCSPRLTLGRSRGAPSPQADGLTAVTLIRRAVPWYSAAVLSAINAPHVPFAAGSNNRLCSMAGLTGQARPARWQPAAWRGRGRPVVRDGPRSAALPTVLRDYRILRLAHPSNTECRVCITDWPGGRMDFVRSLRPKARPRPARRVPQAVGRQAPRGMRYDARRTYYESTAAESVRRAEPGRSCFCCCM